MKTYGETRKDASCEKFTNWSGQQSRKVARRRAKDKKMMHRRARRTHSI